ncbi:MAG: Holliday junction branch migration protein RuvA [Lachnospiraceae bacterium]|nr:Holliday junction branch migration protein RuvA [Lachnospiraceae bacterium]
MIGYLKGTLEESRPGAIIVENGGFGIRVLVSETTRENLPGIGEDVKIYTHMNVREDDISLFGFLKRDELDMFDLLITVNGVGPKGAMGILGIFSVSDIKYFIVTASSDKLSKAPGIGKKTAERIIIDLKDKIPSDEIVTLSDLEADFSADFSSVAAKDAVEALVALGYADREARRAVSNVSNADSMDANDILKAALQYLF